jgi:putative transposase
MFKAFAYRLYPSKSQAARLEAVRETCRHFYNDCLRERKDSYELLGVSITKTEQLRKVKVEKDTSPYALDIHSHILQNVVADLDKAFQAFFRRVKAGETPGYPRFKGKNRFHGFGFKEYGNGFKIDGRRLKLSGIGRIAVRWHREIEGTIKTCRVTCKAGKWYVSFSCEVEKPEPLPKTDREIGIDLGLLRLATLSDGEPIDNPRWYRRIERQLRVIQRMIARRVLGGANRRKAVRRLQRLMIKMANARKDYLNKFANDLIRRFDRIVLEDLRVAAMARGRFAKSILDAGWSYLLTRLAHMAESAGREIELVDPAYTSRTCSGCGVIFEQLKLSDRWVSCECGTSLDRDHNAAINILNRSSGPGHGLRASSLPMDGLAREAAGL